MIELSLFDSVKDNEPEPLACSGRELVELLLDVQSVDRKEAIPLFGPAAYDPGKTRSNDNARDAGILVIDLDGPEVNGIRIGVPMQDLNEGLQRLRDLGLAYLVTPSHGDAACKLDRHKVRLVLYLSRPVLQAQYDRVYVWFAGVFGIDFDEAADHISAIYYLPSVPVGRKLRFQPSFVEGNRVDVDAVLAQIPEAKAIEFDVDPVGDELLDLVQDRARELFDEYLADGAPVAIQGEHGDETTYRVAQRGHDLGLKTESTYHAMQAGWNSRCEPAWSDEGLWKKVQSAYKYSRGARGHKLRKLATAIRDSDAALASHEDGKTSALFAGSALGAFVELQRTDPVRWLDVEAGLGTKVMKQVKKKMGAHQRARKVQQAATLNIDHIDFYKGDEGMFVFVLVDGTEVPMDAATITNPKKFRAKWAATTKRIPLAGEDFRQAEWDLLVSELLDGFGREIETPVEATAHGMLQSLVRDRLLTCATTEDVDQCHYGHAIELDDGRLGIAFEPLYRDVTAARPKTAPQALVRALQTLGVHSQRVSLNGKRPTLWIFDRANLAQTEDQEREAADP